jgi:myo-inositol-1(or 4)-monophosphatase
VCAADLAVDAFLRRELGRLLPAAGWLSRRPPTIPRGSTKDLIWLVDPIDGTRDFIHGRRVGGLGRADQRRQALDRLLFAPARNEEWSAVAGQGAWLNGRRLRRARGRAPRCARARTRLADRGRATSSPSSGPTRSRCASRWSPTTAPTCSPRCAGASSGTSRAAILIAREAGAAVSDAFGRR